MNYSTIKKAVASTMIAALGFATVAEAQEPAKVFGGRSQYRTWSIGLNAGTLVNPRIIFGGSDLESTSEYNLGYGGYLKKQFSHIFSLQADFLKGSVVNDATSLTSTPPRAGLIETDLEWQTGISGNLNLLNIDFLRRKNAVGFFINAGYNIASYKVDKVDGVAWSSTSETTQSIPVGGGVKFKLGEVVALDLGAKMYIAAEGDDVGGDWKGNALAEYGYAYAGLEFTLGNKSKPSLEWSNPVALMYDELMDPSLRNEVEALKQRVSSLEGLVDDLGRDTDGDGVSDKFDKCPNTPAGTVVDGSGCPIKFPEQDTKGVMGDYSAIQFEFDSYVLKTSSYPILDNVSKNLRDTNGSITLEGYASAEGSESYNMQLSKDRANAVKNYLVNSGVAANKINAVGYGEANPVASNATEAGRIQNRRVEFKK